jgi:hypothetical protein
LVGIGGVTPARFVDVAPHVDMLAMISALAGDPLQIGSRLQRMQEQFELARSHP